MGNALFWWGPPVVLVVGAIRADLFVAYMRWSHRLIWGRDMSETYGGSRAMTIVFRIAFGFMAAVWILGAVGYTIDAVRG